MTEQQKALRSTYSAAKAGKALTEAESAILRRDLFLIGHPAYSNRNGSPVVVRGRAAAIEELRSRGVRRDSARVAVRKSLAGEWTCADGIEINGSVRARKETGR